MSRGSLDHALEQADYDIAGCMMLVAYYSALVSPDHPDIEFSLFNPRSEEEVEEEEDDRRQEETPDW